MRCAYIYTSFLMLVFHTSCGGQNIWFGTGGGLSRYDGKSFRNYMMKGDTVIENRTGNSSPNFTNGYGRAFPIIEDKSGRLWFGTNGNTFIYDGRTFAIFRNNEGKAFKNVWSIIFASAATCPMFH